MVCDIISDMDLGLILWWLVIYAFLGWCVEVIYATSSRGIFVNRGFLSGPYCPIYGFVQYFGVISRLAYGDIF